MAVGTCLVGPSGALPCVHVELCRFASFLGGGTHQERHGVCCSEVALAWHRRVVLSCLPAVVVHGMLSVPEQLGFPLPIISCHTLL